MIGSDLHLLVHFDALITCKSVSKAGEQLGISQPAMSSALSRLRYMFNDPLLVRDGNKWTPTRRAIELHHGFQPLLQQWQDATSPQAIFDASTSTRTYTLYASDYIQFAVLPKAVSHIRQQAPHVRLRVLPPKLSGPLDMLSGNHVELYIGHYPDPPDNLRARFLFEETCVSVMRAGHPATACSFSLDTFLAYDHLDASGHAGYFNTQIDAALQGLGKRRNVGAVLSSYLALPFVLASTDMIATLPLSVAGPLGQSAGIMLMPPPLHLPPLSISLFWHERYQADPGHSWLRQCFASAMGN